MSGTTKHHTVATQLAQSLPGYGVTHVFELVGGMVTVLLDAMHQQEGLTVISTHHEQGAGFAAEGFARASGRPAVALATSGPGATNLLTAIGSCYFDSIPVVFITGQVNTHELHRPGVGRQGGFQETDIVSMATPVTKWAHMTTSAESFPADLERAFAVATGGRPGPVLLDIPMDVQRSPVPEHAGPTGAAGPVVTAGAARRASFVEELATALAGSRRPLVLAGGGLRASGAIDAFRAAVSTWDLPVVVSLLGLDSLPASSPQHMGYVGSYGNRWSNWAVSQADVLVVLGSRLDVRQTGSDVAGFRGDRQIFHVDVDESELNNHVTGCRVLNDDLSDFLPALAVSRPPVSASRDAWRDEITAQRALWPDTAENVPPVGINPNLAIKELSEMWGDTGVWVTDVGQHQMWASQSLRLRPDQRFLTSGGMGSMGFGLPAAIGAALATPGRPVSLVAGDGGFQCNMQELQTAVRCGLPLRLLVLDNGCHGMVRQFQQSYFEGRYFSTKWGYSAPDFCAVAAAYGIPAWHATDHGELETAAKNVAVVEHGPALLHLHIDDTLNAYPKMAFGRPYGSMEPAVEPTEMEGT